MATETVEQQTTTTTTTEESTVEQIQENSDNASVTSNSEKAPTDESVVEEIINFCVSVPKRKLLLIKILFAILIVLILVTVFNLLLKLFASE